MKKKLSVFLDSDVIISALISKKGAAFLLVNNKEIIKYISNISLKEIKIVIKRLKLSLKKFESILVNFEIIKIGDNLDEIKNKYNKFVTDKNDAHIVCSIEKSKANFLITYNLKHFNKDLIKQNLKIITLTPALFLQYLRSL